MTNSINITADDVVAAQRLHTTPTRRRMFVMFLLGSVSLVAWYASGLRALSAVAGGFIGVGVVQALTLWLYLPYRARRTYRQQKNLQRSHQFSWDDQAIFFHSEDYEGKIRWSDLLKAREDHSMLLLYQSDALFHLFPKRSFSSPEQFNEFRSHVAALVKR